MLGAESGQGSSERKKRGCKRSWKDMVRAAVGRLSPKLTEVSQRGGCQEKIEDQPRQRINIFEI